MIKLDYSLQTPEERNKFVEKILAEIPEPPEYYLEILADYLVLCMEKQERKERKLLTENRLATVNKRETSYEGLVSQLENGEDGIYNLTINNKNVIFQPKVQITKRDVEEIPLMRQLRDSIKYWEEKMKTAEGKDRYIVKKTIIDLRKDQYVLKNAYRRPIASTKLVNSRNSLCLDDDYSFDEEGNLIPSGISLADPKIISLILCNYSGLKEAAWGEFEKDVWYLMHDFDNIADKALKLYPMYDRLVECKVDGMRNAEIQIILQQEFGISHTVEYISSLWRNKIPKIIAQAAEEEILDFHFLNNEKGTYKKCGKCGQVKLANSRYFSKNTTKDHWYSVCKECRNSRSKKANPIQVILSDEKEER